MDIAEFVDMLKGHVGSWGTEVVISYDGLECAVLDDSMVDGKLVLTLSAGR